MEKTEKNNTTLRVSIKVKHKEDKEQKEKYGRLERSRFPREYYAITLHRYWMHLLSLSTRSQIQTSALPFRGFQAWR